MTIHPAAGARRPSDNHHAAGGLDSPTPLDRVRQSANVLGAVAQIAATVFVVSSGAAERFSGDAAGDPPIIPAGWAFAIWGPIYAGSLSYAILQARPGNAGREDFRRAGWGTALAFFATAAWLLVAVRPSLIWGTVALFVVIGAGLLVAQHAFLGVPPRSRAEALLARAPISVFLGWTSVAVFANTASALRATGVTQPGNETGTSLALLAGATAVAATMARRTRGDIWFVGTVLWAATGIVAANLTGDRGNRDMVVAAAAVVAACVVGAFAAAGRRSAPAPQ